MKNLPTILYEGETIVNEANLLSTQTSPLKVLTLLKLFINKLLLLYVE